MKNLTAQFKLLFRNKQFLITLFIAMLISILAFCINCLISFGKDEASLIAAKYMFLGSDFQFSNMIFYMLSMLFPLLAVFPFADSFLQERKSGACVYALSKQSSNSYYFSKLSAVFISGFLVIAIPLILNIFLNFIAFPLDSANSATNNSVVSSHVYVTLIKTIVFKNLFCKSIYLYNWLYVFIEAITAGLMAVVVYQFSFFYDKSKILLSCSMFACYILGQVILPLFSLDEFDISKYIFAGKFYYGQTARGMIVSYALLLAGAILPIPFARRKLRDLI